MIEEVDDETESSQPDVDEISAEEKTAAYINNAAFEAPVSTSQLDRITEDLVNTPYHGHERGDILDDFAMPPLALDDVARPRSLPVIPNPHPNNPTEPLRAHLYRLTR